jgi:PIN domain nuclease of toxin-antitoxin system
MTRADSFGVVMAAPFDRMLIAQAQARDIPLASHESLFGPYGHRRIG